MDNRNKKDMSVDDLVKQLKLVLDIDEENEDGKPTDVKDDSIITESAPEEINEPIGAEGAGTISDKVRLLDRYFEEEENKKNKKKNKPKLRDRKKKKEKAEDDDLVIKTFEGIKDESDDMSDSQLTSFADEISDMFSDPDEDKTTLTPPVKKEETEEEPKTAETAPVFAASDVISRVFGGAVKQTAEPKTIEKTERRKRKRPKQ